MADSDAATALQLHTRMDVILWNFGPRKKTKKEKESSSRTKVKQPQRGAIIKKMAQHLYEESTKHSRPYYVLTCNATALAHMKNFAKYCKGNLKDTKSTVMRANLCRIESVPGSGTGYVEEDVRDEVLNSCPFGEEEKAGMRSRQLKIALVNQKRVLVVSLSMEQNTEAKKAADQSPANCEQPALGSCAKLQNVITFVEKLRVRLKVDGVLMGRSFNLEENDASRVLKDNERLHGKVFTSHPLKSTAYVVVWPKGMFSRGKVRELKEKDYEKGMPETSDRQEPTMKEAFGHAVLYYKIYFEFSN